MTGLILAFAMLLPTGDEKPDNRGPVAVEKLDRSDPVSFDKEILPILRNKCLTCHSAGVLKGKLDLSSHNSMARGSKSGAAVVPGKAAESLIVKLSGRTQKPFMPPIDEDDLTPRELAILKLWIDQGARGGAAARPPAEVKLNPLPERARAVRALAIRPDKSQIAVGRGAAVTVYDGKSGALVRSLGPMASQVETLAFSPDGKTLAGGSFREVVLWSPSDGTLVRRIGGFADRVMALAWSPDGQWLATGGGSPTVDGEWKLIEAATGRIAFEKANAHSDSIFGVSIRPDGSLLATAGADKNVKVWSIPDGALKKSFEGHAHHVLDVAWKPDGRLLASGGADDVVKVWDYDKGEAVRTIRGHGKQITRLTFIGKSANLATCSGDATARIWNVDGGNQVRVLTGAGDFLYCVAASPDGTLVATGGEDGVVRVYDGNGRTIRSIK